MALNYWLLKAEPDSRIVKGKDVKFSVDDFEGVKISPWEGVRNYEARNLMKEMRVGDKVLFYQSNCKNPGVAAFAEVTKEAYPDYSAWDPEHPYYDAKSDKNNPKWFMVDLTFGSRVKHFVPLQLFKRIATLPSDELPEQINYIGREGCQAIREMDLVTRGRLSVQRVSGKAWNTVQLLADAGGWDETFLGKSHIRSRVKKTIPETKIDEDKPEAGEEGEEHALKTADVIEKISKKRKRRAAVDVDKVEEPTPRKTARARLS